LRTTGARDLTVGPDRSIDNVTYFDPGARILARQAAHHARHQGAYVTDGSDLVFFDGHPKDCPNVVYQDVGVFRRRTILDGEAGSTKFTRQSLAPSGGPS
jgi:hypothetical protein